jgi:3-hydroxybutyryl-CoA dehydrogenase
VPALVVDCGGLDADPDDEDAPLQGGPQVILCDEAPLAELDPEGPAAGFFAAAPLGGLVELTRSPSTSDAAARAAEAFFASLGRHVEWVGDAPGLVLGRIVCQLVNEACFALGDGVGAPEDVDAGMVLGLNHPRGPLEWGDAIGAPSVLGVVAGLYDEYREERYRPAPALLRAVRTGTPLRP